MSLLGASLFSTMIDYFWKRSKSLVRVRCARDLAPLRSKGPQERGGPESDGYKGGCSDCKARAENRRNGSAEENPAPLIHTEKER